MTLTQLRIVVAMSAFLAATESVSGQQGFDRPPTDFELMANSVGMATGGAFIAGGVGFAIDHLYCERHHGKDPSLFVDPCFLYAGAGSTIGWFAGTVVGATLGAARTADKRGCPHESAITSSAFGAAIGLAPSILVLAPRGNRYRQWRSVFTIGAPVLSGLGAAFAVRGCRAP